MCNNLVFVTCFTEGICTGVHSLCSFSNNSQDTGCTIMDDIMTKADDLFPTQTQIEIPPLQP